MRLAPGLVLVALALGCGDDGPGPHELAPGEVTYAAPGSLVSEAGRGSFRLGAATAATQIEDQNTRTDWWFFTASEEMGGLGNGTFVGDASMGYTRALADVALLEEIGLDSYRFSIEWARVEPERDVIDETALAHYGAFLDALIAAGIRPMITVHHFSNPVWVHDPRDPKCNQGLSDANLCGLGHPEGGVMVIEEMAEHARLLAERFGDRVDDWATVNEPINYLLAAYAVGVFPPGRATLTRILEEFMPVVRDYLGAHAAMYRAIEAGDTADADDDGAAASIGFTLSVVDWTPARNNLPSDAPEDVAARDRLEWVFHHLFVEALRQGAFDPDLDGSLDEPQPDWAGTLDWLGVQYYARLGVTGESAFIEPLALTPCYNPIDLGSCLAPEDPSFCVPTMGYEFWVPGLYRILTEFGSRWPDLPLVVSEAGIATEIGARRAENIVRVLEQIERARRAGVDVRGYYHWSLIDNFEWAEGFGPRFGLYQVDYETYDRTATLGAEVLGAIARPRMLGQAQRDQYGGVGPMTPEADLAPGHLCLQQD